MVHIESRDNIVVNLISRYATTVNISVHIEGNDGVNRRYFDQVKMPGTSALLTLATQRTISPGVEGKISNISVSIAPETEPLSPGAVGRMASVYAEVYLSTGRYIALGPQMPIITGAIVGTQAVTLRSSGQGDEIVVSEELESPPAGLPLVLTPWLHESLRYDSLRVTLTTSAVVGNRRVSFVARNYITSTDRMVVFANETQGPGEARTYEFARNINELSPVVPSIGTQVRLPDVRLSPYEQVRVVVSGVDALDTITNAKMVASATFARAG